MLNKYESAMREILAQTQYLLRKDDDQFRLKPIYNKAWCRYEVHVLMGRKEFDEYYIFTKHHLGQDWYCQAYYDKFYRMIKTNLKLNEAMYK
jgi:hypothetical protein